MMRLRPIRTLAMATLFVGALLATGCGIFGGGTASEDTYTFTASEVENRPAEHYVRQLRELPLRFYEEGRWHIDLKEAGKDGSQPAVREVHLLRDSSVAAQLREPRPTDKTRIAGWNARRNEANKRDTLLVVFDDNTLVSVAARTFTVNWTSKLKRRVEFKPVMTKESIFFIDKSNGEFQRIDRYTGEVTNIDKFGTGFFPNAQPAANDTHIIIPTTNSNAVEGRPDDDASNSINPLVWHFPSSRTGSDSDFGMVMSQPLADENNVYFVSRNNKLYSLRASDGLLIWSLPLESIGLIRTRPVLYKGVIYVGSDTQFFAVSLEGKILWSYTPELGEVFEGGIYVMDGQVFVRTGKVTDGKESSSRNRNLSYGITTQDTPVTEHNIKPSRLIALSFNAFRASEGDRVLAEGPKVEDWSEENLKQKVLLKTAKDLFVQYEEWEIPYNRRRQEQLRESGKVVRQEELRKYSKRVIRVLDPKTGKVRKHQGQEASYTMNDFSFVIGSQDDSDRALYFVTKDGHLFKGFELNTSRR